MLERAKELRKQGIHNMELLLTRVSKVGFYNTTKLDFAAITAAPDDVRRNLLEYLGGFSQEAREMGGGRATNQTRCRSRN
ncbi:MAG TPA: hypothetical protein VHJ83_14405 [Micromonosporaceae bacterium]|nr:hypothetical protein [Micromonosporaceae bacterium]